MTAGAPVLAHVLISLAAVVGLWQVTRVLVARGRHDPINRRFLIGLRVIMAIFAGRALEAMTGVDAFRAIVLVAAGLVPVLVVTLAEGLLRRHAPGWAKWVVAVGTAVFAISGLWYWSDAGGLRPWGLLAFQLFGMALAGWMVVTRDRDSLSAAENDTVVRLGLSIGLLVPLIAADYMMEIIGLPVQISGLAVLFLCWLAMSLGRTEGHGAALRAFAVMAGAGLLAGVALAVMVSLTWSETLVLLALVLAVVLAGAVVNDGQGLLAAEGRLTLTDYLARGDVGDGAAILRGLVAHRVVSGAVRVSSNELADGPGAAAVAALFETGGLVMAADLPAEAGARDVAGWLMDRYGATHVIAVRREPLELIALNLPAMASTGRTESELAALGRMARLAAGARADGAGEKILPAKNFRPEEFSDENSSHPPGGAG